MNSTARYPMVSYEEATPEVQTIYDDTKKTLQLPFVLNWFKCQGDNATLLKGNWSKLKNTLMEGEVPNVLKQLIIYNVSKQRGCSYCSHAHGIFADSMSAMISEEKGFKATENMNSPSMPASFRTAVKIVTSAALNHNEVSDQDFAELEKAGFSKKEIQELMAQADLVNMLNTIADVSGIKIDNELLETPE
ncbi:alkylhydroperoxidase AhpD family core domain-containing protein [Salegentibacter echinorum]|uniref:Alkylhydroperoxidase AhpD family core domain-containing protein n=1 Tax=Salegentibacter echinorum TaxID=1073325 RepID=A0A1M5C836_SALEC|nr:carboxymuconolactone decarboxylase family protein [Salegentibacter echinorum]SHF50767.1 alkylhydroperoxidase AhpD family core domain-containing protein [Salegentibacter echinorum]